MWIKNFQIFKLDLEKAEEQEIKLPTSLDHRKSKKSPEKHLLLLHWLHWSLCVDHNKLRKILQEREYKTTWLTSWEICMQVKQQQLELDMEQWTGSKLGKEYVKAVYYCPASVQFSSLQLLSRVWLFATPWNAACQACLSVANSWSLLKLMSIKSMMASNHLFLYRPLLFPPSIFPNFRVFSNVSVLCIRWPKYWSQLQHHSF